MSEKLIPRPWHPAAYDEFVVGSVRALFAGTADERQQKRAIDWILFDLCGVRDLSFRPDSQRDTDFAEGKRFVGLQLVKVSKVPAGAPPPAQRSGRMTRRKTQGD